MLPLGVLAAALGLNYRQHRHGLPTICSTVRRILPPAAAISVWCGITAWFIPHIWRGYTRP